jgi:flavorubredoxin
MTMETTVDEIADRIYRMSTFVPDIGPTGFTFNQFLIDAEEPTIFHTGPRGMFPSVSGAIASLIPLERLRWITFGHLESDECGAMNLFLEASPNAQVAHTAIGCMVSINDLADRTPVPMTPDGSFDLGGRSIRNLETPHVPHGWDAHVIFEETTRTLFCGDLLTQVGNGPSLTQSDIVGAAVEAEDMFGSTGLTPQTAPTIRRLAELNPATLATMHGSSYNGEAVGALLALADEYERRLSGALPATAK